MKSTSRRVATKQPAAIGLRRVRPRSARTTAPLEVGRLVGVGPDGQAWLDLPEAGLSAVSARTVVPVTSSQIGREVLVSFVGSKARRRPVVIGVLCDPAHPPVAAPQARMNAIVDGERVVLTGRDEVVLRCGKASIALSANGDVVIKGVRLLAATSGLHRIRGGAVEIN